MPIRLPPKGAEYVLVPEGTHIAVCYRVIDLGTQAVSYQNKTSYKPQLLLSWELPEEKMDDGRPFTISRRYTYSSSTKSNLRKDLESWRGKRFEDRELGEFDITKLLGVGCMLGIIHVERDENTYANISTIMKLPRGTQAPPLFNDPISLSLSDRPFDRRTFDMLSDNLRDTIVKSVEYKIAVGQMPEKDDGMPEYYETPTSERDYDDEIPF